MSSGKNLHFYISRYCKFAFVDGDYRRSMIARITRIKKINKKKRKERKNRMSTQCSHGNFAFWLYDFAVTRLKRAYRIKFIRKSPLTLIAAVN